MAEPLSVAAPGAHHRRALSASRLLLVPLQVNFPVFRETTHAQVGLRAVGAHQGVGRR